MTCGDILDVVPFSTAFWNVPPETGKQLCVGLALLYFLLSTISLILWKTGSLDKVKFVPTDADIYTKCIVVVVLVLLGIGAVVVYLVFFAIVVCVWLSLAVVLVPLWVVAQMATAGPGGVVLAIPLLGLYVWGMIRAYPLLKPEAIKVFDGTVLPLLRTVVEFFAWCDFVVKPVSGKGEAKSGANDGTREASGAGGFCANCGYPVVGPKCVNCGASARRTVEMDMPDKDYLHAQMAQLRHQYPDLPVLPKAFQRTQYEGWFAEARKRFEMQTYSRTQAEREAFLEQVAKIRDLWLKIARQESDYEMLQKEHVERVDEHEIRAKKRQVEKIELDMKLEELGEQRKKRKEPPPPPKRPRTPGEEFRERLRTMVRDRAEARAERDRAKKEHPELADEIDREYENWLWDQREAR